MLRAGCNQLVRVQFKRVPHRPALEIVEHEIKVGAVVEENGGVSIFTSTLKRRAHGLQQDTVPAIALVRVQAPQTYEAEHKQTNRNREAPARQLKISSRLAQCAPQQRATQHSSRHQQGSQLPICTSCQCARPGKIHRGTCQQHAPVSQNGRVVWCPDGHRPRRTGNASGFQYAIVVEQVDGNCGHLHRKAGQRHN